MSNIHGGYDQEELAAAAGIGGGEGDVRSRMESFANTMPGGEAESSGESSATPPAGAASPLPAPDNTRRVRATPKKLKKILGGIPAKILETTGITLDRDDQETLDEAGEFLGDIFGFEFAVPESKVMVQSRLWAVLWVFGVAGLVYIKHRFPEVFKAAFEAIKKGKDGDETTNAEVSHGN